MTDNLADKIAKEQPEDDPAPASRRRAARGSRKTSTPRSRKTSSSSANRKSVKKPLEELFGVLGAAVSMVDPVDGAIVLARAEQTARALDDIAKDSPSVHRVLSLLTTGQSGWAGVAMAMAPIILPMAHHHGLLRGSPMVDQMAAGMMPEEARKMEAMMRDFNAAAEAAQQPEEG